MTFALAKVSLPAHGVAVTSLPVDLKPLQQALRTLAEPQGGLARRNARRRVSKALAALRAAVELAYPAPARIRKVAKRRTLGQRRKALIADGWVVAREMTLLAYVAVNGLPVKLTPSGALNPLSVMSLMAQAETWIPGWLAHYYCTDRPASVIKAHASKKLRDAGVAAVKLGSLADAVRKGVVACPTA